MKTLGNSDKIYAKSNDKRNTVKNSQNDLNVQTSKQEMFSEINEWKSFCHKQIIKNNLDYIV